ncbi:hypothetical protein TNCV_4273071 [Trichonephila clavipes]|nr:hypothetical protein TNCV_4273071 [Trichonephila clavipes]
MDSLDYSSFPPTASDRQEDEEAIPESDQRAKQGIAWSQPEVPLTLRRAKSFISVYIDKCTTMTQDTWKAMGNPGHSGFYPGAYEDSRGNCPLTSNHWVSE